MGGVIKTGVFEESRKAVKNNEIHCYFLFNLITFPVRALLYRSPQSVSGREGVPKELSEPMARRIRGSGCWTLPNLFPGERVRRRSPSEAMERRTRGSASWPSPNLFQDERMQQRSSPKSGRVVLGALLRGLPPLCLRSKGCAKGDNFICLYAGYS